MQGASSATTHLASQSIHSVAVPVPQRIADRSDRPRGTAPPPRPLQTRPVAQPPDATAPGPPPIECLPPFANSGPPPQPPGNRGGDGPVGHAARALVAGQSPDGPAPDKQRPGVAAAAPGTRAGGQSAAVCGCSCCYGSRSYDRRKW